MAHDIKRHNAPIKSMGGHMADRILQQKAKAECDKGMTTCKTKRGQSSESRPLKK